MYSQLEGERSHAVNTAWALLALLAAGYHEVDRKPLDAAARCLIKLQVRGAVPGATWSGLHSPGHMLRSTWSGADRHLQSTGVQQGGDGQSQWQGGGLSAKGAFNRSRGRHAVQARVDTAGWRSERAVLPACASGCVLQSACGAGQCSHKRSAPPAVLDPLCAAPLPPPRRSPAATGRSSTSAACSTATA